MSAIQITRKGNMCHVSESCIYIFIHDYTALKFAEHRHASHESIIQLTYMNYHVNLFSDYHLVWQVVIHIFYHVDWQVVIHIFYHVD